MGFNTVGAGASKFQQQEANIRKVGAYYTDPEHCRDLGKNLKFSNEAETCVLEPSAGDGTAVKLVTGKEKNPMIRLFGVEINANSCELLENSGAFEKVLKADFKTEVFITNNAFSFVFGNPPYMEELNFERSYGAAKERTEKVFLDKVHGYMRSGGIIVWVIPHRVFMEDTYTSFWMSRFETLRVYKFREPEFSKWGQIALIGKKRGCNVGIMKEDRIAMQNRCQLDLLAEVPTTVNEDEMIEVPPSSPAAIQNFRTKQFSVEAAEKFIEDNPAALKALYASIAAKTGLKERDEDRIFTPPKPLAYPNLALLTACGVGSGYAGSVEEGNLHLQRGSVEIQTDEQTDLQNGTVTVTKRSITNIVLVEQSGKITDLVKQDGKDLLDNLEEEDVAS